MSCRRAAGASSSRPCAPRPGSSSGSSNSSSAGGRTGPRGSPPRPPRRGGPGGGAPPRAPPGGGGRRAGAAGRGGRGPAALLQDPPLRDPPLGVQGAVGANPAERGGEHPRAGRQQLGSPFVDPRRGEPLGLVEVGELAREVVE